MASFGTGCVLEKHHSECSAVALHGSGSNLDPNLALSGRTLLLFRRAVPLIRMLLAAC